MNFSTIANVVNTLTPVFLIILIGAVLRHVGFLTEAFSSALNKFVFWCPLPCMIVHTIMHSTTGSDWMSAAAVLMLSTVLVALIAWFGAGLFGISRFSRGSFTQTVFRSNNAYIGIPVMMMACAGRPGAGNIGSLAMLTLAPCLVLYNVLAVLVLTKPDDGGKRMSPSQSLPPILKGVAKNPLIIACVAGSVGLFSGVQLPRGIDGTIETLGKMATSGALIALGASLTIERMARSFRAANIAAFLKLVACPLIGLLLALAFGLSAEARFVVLVYLACPSAVASFVMAEAMGGDSVLAGSGVAVSTVYSVGSLALVLLLAMPG